MSQNAIKGSMPVYGCDAERCVYHILNGLRNTLNVKATTLGSTGKKKDNAGDEQFEISDGRSFDQMYADMTDEGMQPVLNDYVYVG